MLNSYINTVMTMKCDVYVQQNTQSDSGMIGRKWAYSKTIPCRIEPINSRGSSNSPDNKVFESGGRKEYYENLDLKLKTTTLLSKRWRISSIRDNKNNKLFLEADLLDQPDTIFEVVGSHPILDPFGNISYYEVALMRIPVQSNDTNRI